MSSVLENMGSRQMVHLSGSSASSWPLSTGGGASVELQEDDDDDEEDDEEDDDDEFKDPASWVDCRLRFLLRSSFVCW